MAKVEGLSNVAKMIKKLADKYGEEIPSVTVGATQSYALWVHENMEAHHPVGQAKFLEQPSREMQGQINKVVADTVKQGGTVTDGLVRGGLLLQRSSQELTPVDTGALKASHFTCLTKDVEAVSQAAYKKSESIRQGTLKKRGGGQ